MFKRLLLEDSNAVFTVVAFITAAAIYLTISWRAFRMKRPQLERFENLPFASETPAARHDHAA